VPSPWGGIESPRAISDLYAGSQPVAAVGTGEAAIGRRVIGRIGATPFACRAAVRGRQSWSVPAPPSRRRHGQPSRVAAIMTVSKFMTNEPP
jgi:hypothetical protein